MALSFDAAYYYENRPDVLRAFLNSDMSVSGYDFAVAHYNEFGWAEGANPNEVFNTAEYLAANTDVADAGVNPFAHYQEFGQSEGRAPNADFPSLADFDADAYLAQNPDLGEAGITTKEAAYDHYITLGWNEGRPGAPDSAEFQLKKALANLAAANEALATFVADADTVANLEAALDVAKDKLDTDITDNGSDRALAANLADAQDAAAAAHAAVAAADEDFVEAVAAYDQLTAELVAAKAVRDAAEAASEAAIEAFIEAQAADDVEVELSADRQTLTIEPSGLVIAQFQLFDGSTTDGRFVVTSDGLAIDGLADIVTGINDYLAASDAVNDIQADRDAARADLEADADNGALFTAALDADAAVKAAQELIDARAELVSDVADAQATYDQGVVLEEAVAAAEQAIIDLGYELPILVDTDVAGTAANDLFLFVNDDATMAQDITGFSAGDLLFIGNDYTATTLAAGDNLNGSDDFGSLTGLDIFIQQVGADTVVYVELDTYDGHANGPWAGETITLLGVSADTVSFANGYITVTDAIV